MEEYAFLARVIPTLLLVPVLAYLALRYGLKAIYPGLGRSRLRVLEKIPLDAKSGSALLLVQAGDELLLLGLARGGVSLIKELEPELLTDKEGQPAGDTPAVPDGFAGFLKQAGRSLLKPLQQEWRRAR